MKKILTLLGARPQFIKASVVSNSISKFDKIKEIIIHSGQHYDFNMSKCFFEDLKLKTPDYNLGCSNTSHLKMISNTILKFGNLATKIKPNLILVYGDTNTTLAGAIVASKLSLPLAHIEAGLRSYNRAMPEENNRKITDHLSNLLFCPTVNAKKNLIKEGINKNSYFVGDVMYDLMKQNLKKISELKYFKILGLEVACYSLLTIHRFENITNINRLKQIFQYVLNQSKKKILFIIHPGTKKIIQNNKISLERFIVVEPLGYFETASLLQNCHSIFTDSGGLQKEAYFWKKKCTTLRDETEWTETINKGWNKLWTSKNYKKEQYDYDFGDGNASDKIVEIIETQLK